MKGTKCSKCGVVNLLSDVFCRRCGSDLWRSVTSGPRRSKGPREAARSSSFVWTLIFLAIVAGGAYYIFLGVERSYSEVNWEEANRLSNRAQPAQISRSEHERERTSAAANALKNTQGISEARKHNDETRQLIESSSNKPEN